ncbi:MAG: ATP-binding cassette domain-containing protein [Candidatus Bathyarchaeota archaeon]|nr:ATP-binding cassette domain-containing protein [Candidatus Bathyarchaeota archaeon]
MTSDFVIQTKALRKIFVSKEHRIKKEFEAVKGIDLMVRRGEIFGFLGPNGAGKSTTQKMLSTLMRPTSGEVKVLGFELATQQEQIRKNVGFVSQAGGANLAATGVENLVLQAQLYGINKQTAKKYAKEFAERFQMTTFVDRAASTYSGGQKRRLDIALGMIHHPQLLLLDEPTTGLDPQSRAYLWEEIKKLQTDGVTIFLTTQYMDEADKLCDTIAIIDHGKIIITGTPEELKDSVGGDTIVLGFLSPEQTQKAEVVLSKKFEFERIQTIESSLHITIKNGELTLPELLRLLDSEDLPVQGVTLSRPSLDDVFLKYTGRSLREDGKTP